MRTQKPRFKFLRPMAPSFVFAKYLCTSPFDTARVANDLVSIFTKRPLCPENPQLKGLGSRLSTQIVEAVLANLRSWRVASSFFNWAAAQDGYMHNIYTYNAMASILSRARQNAALRDLLESVVNSCCVMSPGALGFLVRCLGTVGMAIEANELFDRVRARGLCVPNSYSYNCLLEAVSRSNCVQFVEMRLQEMYGQNMMPDKYTLTTLLRVYCNADEPEKAWKVFSEVVARGWVDAHVCSILVLAFSKWGHVDKAFELIETMEQHDVLLNEKTFCVLIHGFVNEGRVDKALLLLNKMKTSNFVPDVSIYDVIIGGLCRDQEDKKVMQLYAEMNKIGVKPDFGIVSKLIYSFSGQRELVYLLDDIIKDTDAEPQTLACNAVLNHFVNVASVDIAYHLLRVMMGNEIDGDVEMNKLYQVIKLVTPDDASFTIVLNGLLKDGKLDLALTLFQDMVQFGCKTNLAHYNNLIDGLCESNRLEESYEVFREMGKSGVKPTQFTYNCILGCLCRKKDVVGALSFAKEMRLNGHEPYIKHTTLLVEKLCDQGNVTEACRFLDDMVLEGFSPEIISYSAILDGLVKNHKVDHAMKLFQDICNHGRYPDVVAYNIMIKGLCKAQRLSEAQNLVNEMVTKGLIPSVVTYNSLVDVWCKSGQIDEAMLFLSEMSVKEREPNVITYTTLIDGLCNAGRADEAVLLWNEMWNKGITPTRVAFMALIHGLCKCGRPDSALIHLREMEKEGMKPDAYVYSGLISAFLACSNLPLAFEMLKEMVEKGDSLDQLDKNYNTLRDVIPKLLEDSRTSSSLRDFIAKCGIPAVFLEDKGEAT